jgi:transposase
MDIAQNAPDTVILAEDEAALYLQATTTAVWAPRGQTPLVRLDPQRHKTNFYGALDLCTGNEVVARSTTMNAQTTAQHLNQILQAFPQRQILLFWDRAPWHFGPPIRDILSANPRLEIMYFPVAAPDLNPQEQVWKATRRAVSHNHNQRRLPELADNFQDHLTTHTFTSAFLVRYGFNTICPVFT